MRSLVLILIAFIAVFTFFQTLDRGDNVHAEEIQSEVLSGGGGIDR
ncbi:MAG: hypothetical protein LBH51_09375 [Treponema sp.]|jgi:hypothetical protein|nr:hypothetical protein [Treponema sp.]